MPAEIAYFFRLPLLRDAAYQLQVPSDRARLHRLALEITETMFGGRPPEPQPDQWGDLNGQPHTTDPYALDLAEHARGVRIWAGDDDGSLLARELLYLRRGAEYSGAQFDNDAAVRLWERLAALVEEDAPVTASKALRRAGAILLQGGRTESAEPLLQRALRLAVSAGARRAEGEALGNLAVFYWMSGRAETAEQTCLQALALHREVGNRRLEGADLGNLAGILGQTGRLNDAEAAYRRALTIHREVGDRRFEGGALTNLANLYQETGRMGEAEQAYEEGLTIIREVGDRLVEGGTLGNLADLYQQIGRLAEAEQTYQQALAIHREVGNRTFEGLGLGNLANLYDETGRRDEAESTFRQALTIHRETKNRRFEGIHTCDYALCLAARQGANARELWRVGAELLKEVGDKDAVEQKTAKMREACAKAGVPPFDT